MVEQVILNLLKKEGGLSNHPQDKGGLTKFGITRTTLAVWRKDPKADVSTLTVGEAVEIYRTLYVHNVGLDKLPTAILEQMLDFGVNSGPYVAITALQESLGIKADGIIGPMTVAHATTACIQDGGRGLNNTLAKWRIMMLGRIVRKDPSQLVFLGGWLSRANSFIQ